MSGFKEWLDGIVSKTDPASVDKNKKPAVFEDAVIEHEPSRPFEQVLKDLPQEFKDRINGQ